MNHHKFVLALPLLALIAAPSRADTLYVTEANDTIYSYDPSLTNPTLFYNAGLQQALTGITFDGSGNAYVGYAASVTPALNGTIQEITPTGQTSTYATIGSGSYLAGLTFDSSGNLYAADGNNSVIDKVDSSGNVTLFANLNSQLLPSNYGPNTLAFDGSGNLYAAVGTGVFEYDSMGNYQGELTDNGAITGAQAIAFDPAGNLYIANGFYGYPNDGNIYEYSATGQWSLFATTGLSLIQSMVIDSSGNLYLSSENAGNFGGTIQEYSTTGASSGSLIASVSPSIAPEYLAVFQPAVVPEPSSLILVVTGLAGGLTFAARRVRALKARSVV